jgi:hypothetical protein
VSRVQAFSNETPITNAMPTELQLLIDRVKAYEWYPPDIRPLYGDSTETLFFPAGPGMYYPEEGKLSNKAVMVTCDRYTTQLNFLKLHGVRQDRTRSASAWNELLTTLLEGGIDPLDCFFTNFLLGVRRSSGTSIRLSSPYFLDYCRDIFQFTLELQRPRIILVFGLKAASFLSRLHPMLAAWQNITIYHDVDDRYQSIIRDVPLVQNQLTTLVLLVHPVGRKTHISTRKNGNSSGEAAENSLLRTVVASCKLQIANYLQLATYNLQLFSASVTQIK